MKGRIISIERTIDILRGAILQELKGKAFCEHTAAQNKSETVQLGNSC